MLEELGIKLSTPQNDASRGGVTVGCYSSLPRGWGVNPVYRKLLPGWDPLGYCGE